MIARRGQEKRKAQNYTCRYYWLQILVRVTSFLACEDLIVPKIFVVLLWSNSKKKSSCF